jgi:hypothetical protein
VVGFASGTARRRFAAAKAAVPLILFYYSLCLSYLLLDI